MPLPDERAVLQHLPKARLRELAAAFERKIDAARDDRSKYAHEPASFWIRSFVRHFREHL